MLQQPDMDHIFPAPFFDRLREAREPEKRLMATILEDAVLVYRDHPRARTARDRALLGDVEAWFDSEEAAYPFSFLRITQELGIDPVWFRYVLARWRSYQSALRDGVPRVAHTLRLAS